MFSHFLLNVSMLWDLPRVKETQFPKKETRHLKLPDVVVWEMVTLADSAGHKGGWARSLRGRVSVDSTWAASVPSVK